MVDVVSSEEFETFKTVIEGRLRSIDKSINRLEAKIGEVVTKKEFEEFKGRGMFQKLIDTLGRKEKGVPQAV